MLEQIKEWWDSRTTWAHGKVVMIAGETILLWGLLRFYRYRAYLTTNVDNVSPQVAHHTFRSVKVGPVTIAFRLPKCVEDRLE